jgi:multiple sugar transport system substrate-binding protein
MVRWLATGTAALVLAAACSSSSSPTPAATSITFTYLAIGNQPDQNFQEAAKAFHAAHPDIEVRGTKIPNTLAALKGANAPDVMQINRDWLGEFTSNDALYQLPTGQTTIPWFIDTRAVYYRSDILQQLNIDPAGAFNDWEAFDHTLDAIKSSGKIAPFGIAGKNDSNIVGSFAPWIWEAGGSLMSEDGKRATINEPRSVDGVDEFQRFGGKYADPAALQQDSASVDAMFAAGKFAVTISGPGLALKTKNVPFGVKPFPYGHAGHVVYAGGSNLAIAKTSKHESAAYAWVTWLVSSEAQTGYVQKLGMYPALASAAQPGAFQKQLSDGRSFPTYAAWPRIQEALAPDLGKIWDAVIAGSQPMAKDQLQTLLDGAAADMQMALA